jgi:tryptophanyl-tRNA synthetase
MGQEEKKLHKKVVLTGDRPTGPLHLGHYVGSLANRLLLQESCQQFVMLADVQALTDNFQHPQKVRENVLEITLDYLAIGLDPRKSTIFIQSLIPAIPELTLYYLNLVTWNRLTHNPTVKQEIRQKRFGESVPAGFVIYPVHQAADITAFRADIVPVGEDQLPMLEQCNEIVRRFNTLYECSLLVEAQPMIPKIARLPGIDGKNKMGKSLNNAIFLSDTPDTVVKKVRSMYTDPNHLRVEDPGTVEGNPVFIYLEAFATDQKMVSDLENAYRKGGLGDAQVKNYLTEVLLAFLEPIQKKRQEFTKDLGAVWKILQDGSQHAAAIAAETLSAVKDVMHLHYA